MSLLLLAPVPPATIRSSLSVLEWNTCLDAWLHLAEYTLQLPLDQLVSTPHWEQQLGSFLHSLYTELSHFDASDDSLSGPKAHALQRKTFKLVNRLASGHFLPYSLLTIEFLSVFCRAHMRSAAIPRPLHKIWTEYGSILEPSVQKERESLVKLLDSKASLPIRSRLDSLAFVLRASSDVAAFFFTGTDFIDGLIAAYNIRPTTEDHKALVGIAYLGLISLIQIANPNVSTLSDHLYNLRSQADHKKNEPSLLADLVTNTPLVLKLRRMVVGKSTERISNLLDTLDTYRMSSLVRTRHGKRRSGGKGKARHNDVEMHMHQMSLVAQVQDLFPDLGSGFVLVALDEYGNDVEQVTAHLLEDSLPPHLRSMDRQEQADFLDFDQQREIQKLVPRSTPPPALEQFITDRRNAFDEDELDRLEVDTARLHMGKKDKSPLGTHGNKAAILCALAAFDSDDDERDDTYDIEDVGGTVDSAHPDGEPGPSASVIHEENEQALFISYKATPELFGRTFNVRRSQPRAALKTETGMTDEAIEGWAIMLQRDPQKLKRLESRHGAFDGRQNVLNPTAYRDSPGNTETEDSDVPGASQRGAFKGRGRGRGRGRGGNVAGPSSEAGTAEAQRRKEASKGSRANHNRRDQRAKKMARGGFAG